MEWLNEALAAILAVLNQGNITALGALFLVTVLTEACIPFPFILDATLFLSAYQNGPSLELMYTFAVIFLGRFAGASIVYWAARMLGDALISQLEKRFKKIKRTMMKIESRIASEAAFAIAIPRISGLMTLTSLASGAICLRYGHFLVGVILSSLIFDGALIIFGFIMNSGFNYFGFTPELWQVGVFLVLTIIIIWIIRLSVIRRRATMRHEDKDTYI
jgi:membrane protein DedA with SNARE-associated domain